MIDAVITTAETLLVRHQEHGFKRPRLLISEDVYKLGMSHWVVWWYKHPKVQLVIDQTLPEGHLAVIEAQ